MNPNHIVEVIEKAFSEVEWVETSLRQFKITDEWGLSGDAPDSVNLEWNKARDEWHKKKSVAAKNVNVFLLGKK